uniref:Uncharacterized protein n=1 Tax=Glossina morsitans morsitans TaxID=37546 RepID=A0A1B0G480_GLOMM
MNQNRGSNSFVLSQSSSLLNGNIKEGSKNVTGEKNKVKFSDTVQVAVVPKYASEISFGFPISATFQTNRIFRLAGGTGHAHRTAQANDSEYVCLWRNCIRVRKSMQAFPTLLRLIKHVHEVHLSKPDEVVYPNERSKNYVPRKTKVGAIISQQITTNTGINVATNSLLPRVVVGGTQAEGNQIQYQPQVLGQSPEPMFVTVPPRPQRVLRPMEKYW